MKNINRTVFSRRYSSGVGLVEVLISVLVLAVGLLGMAAMQATSLRNSQSAYERSQAITQAYALVDLMRANRAQARIGAYRLNAWTCTPPAAGTSRALDDIRVWMQSMQQVQVLGTSACVRITSNTVGETWKISVRWDDSRADGGSNQQELFVESRI